MKSIRVKEKYRLTARLKRLEGGERKLDYYLDIPEEGTMYLFTRNYSNTCYDACKSGIGVMNILYGRKRNVSYMNLVKCLKRMMPYLVEYYELEME